MLDDSLIRHPADPGQAASAEREFPFTQADFRAIAAVLHDEAGISLPQGKAPLVYARLAKRLRALQISDFAHYVERLHGPDSAGERRHLLTALTTNVTRFFREPHHFEHLRSAVLEPLMRDPAKRRIRIWSAACSTGQEPYSIAAIVAGLAGNRPQVDLKILATDIDPDVLDRGKTGRFGSIEGIPAEHRRWFERDGNEWVVAPLLRQMVTFRPLNLNARWPVNGPFDAIFCRNVAIYFNQDAQARLWSAFATVMPPGGTLYIGHSERVGGPAMAAFSNVGVTTYQRLGSPP